MVGATLLGQRLQSLARAGVAADIRPGQGEGGWLVGLRFAPGVLTPAAAQVDADGVIDVLATLVTRSGYAWQPELGAA